MNALIPIAATVPNIDTLLASVPEIVTTWGPLAAAVVLGVGLIGAVAAVVLGVFLGKRKPANAI